MHLSISLTIFSLAIALLATFSTPAMADDTAKANRLFVTAITDWQAAADLAGNNRTTADQRVKLLQGVVTRLNVSWISTLALTGGEIDHWRADWTAVINRCQSGFG